MTADTRRREAVIASALNGIDFIEVIDAEAPTPADRQRILRVNFLKAPPPAGITPANIVITGGDRITGIAAESVTIDGNALVVHLTAYGDFSTYNLAIKPAGGTSFDPATLDPLLAAADFSFKGDCPSEFDCQTPPPTILPPLPGAPHLDYLAKDYPSFRQLMLDRLAASAPQWTERNPADLGVTLVEMFAHVGDLLSYRQDAVATEAYLGTARRRVSVRRHARLVDYVVQEGVNARTFVHVEVGADIVLPKGVQTFTAMPGQALRLAPGSPDLAKALTLEPEIFETMHDARLFKAHNAISIYTWGDANWTLAKGATSVALSGQLTDLKPGDVLIFEEVIGPRTGLASDADPTRRHAVRLASVSFTADPLGGALATPPGPGPLPVTVVAWSREDATPFDFQVTGAAVAAGVAHKLQDITMARGNNVLTDHGASVVTESVGAAPAPSLFRPPVTADGDPAPIPPRFRPRLQRGPLVYAVPDDPANPPVSARAALTTSPADALPFVALTGTLPGQAAVPWTARSDLLQSDPAAPDFVVETESDGSAYLRFGDDANGQRPPPGTAFTAQYRIGEAIRGNVAADAIAHVAFADPAVTRVRNPLPARGGVAPESLDHVRMTAPFAFRTQRRAVTPDDYQAMAERHPGVQRAAASLRWTGSWSTFYVTVERLGGLPVDDAFAQEIRGFLEPFRLAGHDLEIDGPEYVPLDIALLVTAQPDHFRSDIKAALLQTFGTGFRPDGQKDIFNPDNFTFGQPVYLGVIYAAAQAVDGVAAVQVTRFQRRGRPDPAAIARGRLDFARLEIARLDNDPDHRERGVFTVTVQGGK